jgi:urate oxidase
MIELGPNRYGKSAIRLVKVVRGPDRHQVRDLTVSVALEGDFEAAHVDDDNSAVIATDTMKNTAYALAGEHLTGSIEAFALVLGRHFLAADQVGRVTVSIDEHAWRPIGPAPDAFVRDGTSTRTAASRQRSIRASAISRS